MQKLKDGLKRGNPDFDEDLYTPDMPPVEGADYLLSYLTEIGPVMRTDAGAAPLTHVEIAKWQSNTGIELNAWEARTLHRLSADYFAESHKAKKIDCPAPWIDQELPVVPASNARAESLRAELRELANL